MPPHRYPYFSNHLHSTWSDGLGRLVRTMKVAAIAGTFGAAAGTVGAIAIISPHPKPAPTGHQIIADVDQAVARPPTRVGSAVHPAPSATVSLPAAPSHRPAETAAVQSPPSPPGWPLLPGTRPHSVEAATPETNRLYDRVEAKNRAASKGPASETAASPVPERAAARGERRSRRSKAPQIIAAMEPATALPVPRAPTIIVPPRAMARGARHKHSPNSFANWRYASRRNYGDDDGDDWRDRDDHASDRSDWRGGFLGLFGDGDWGN